MICLYAYVSYINHHIIHAWISRVLQVLTFFVFLRLATLCHLVTVPLCNPCKPCEKGFPVSGSLRTRCGPPPSQPSPIPRPGIGTTAGKPEVAPPLRQGKWFI